MRILNGVTLAAGIGLLLSCGGDAGNGDVILATPPSLSLSTHQIAITAALTDPAPTATLLAYTFGTVPSPNPFVIGISIPDSNGAILSAGGTATSDTTSTITLAFQQPAVLGVGIYENQATIWEAQDENDLYPIANSPQVVTLTYTVTPLVQAEKAPLRQRTLPKGMEISRHWFLNGSQKGIGKVSN